MHPVNERALLIGPDDTQNEENGTPTRVASFWNTFSFTLSPFESAYSLYNNYLVSAANTHHSEQTIKENLISAVRGNPFVQFASLCNDSKEEIAAQQTEIYGISFRDLSQFPQIGFDESRWLSHYSTYEELAQRENPTLEQAATCKNFFELSKTTQKRILYLQDHFFTRMDLINQFHELNAALETMRTAFKRLPSTTRNDIESEFNALSEEDRKALKIVAFLPHDRLEQAATAILTQKANSNTPKNDRPLVETAIRVSPTKG